MGFLLFSSGPASKLALTERPFEPFPSVAPLRSLLQKRSLTSTNPPIRPPINHESELSAFLQVRGPTSSCRRRWSIPPISQCGWSTVRPNRASTPYTKHPTTTPHTQKPPQIWNGCQGGGRGGAFKNPGVIVRVTKTMRANPKEKPSSSPARNAGRESEDGFTELFTRLAHH